MPIVPTVLPLIVAGVLLGSLLVSEKRKISKKRLVGVSLVGGLLNAANAVVVYLLFPPTTFSRFGGGNFGGGNFGGSSSFTFTGSSSFRGGAAGGGEGSFILLSFITGLLIVLVVVGSALLYVRYKGGHGEEQLDEEKEEGQDELEEPKREEQEEI
jgi:uncharacterized membrane protein